MEVNQSSIVAIVTMQEQSIKSGGAPIFIAKSKEELEQISVRLQGILDASAHELDQETILIVAR